MTVYFPVYCKPGQICKFAICVAGFAHPDNTVHSARYNRTVLQYTGVLTFQTRHRSWVKVTRAPRDLFRTNILYYDYTVPLIMRRALIIESESAVSFADCDHKGRRLECRSGQAYCPA